MKAAIAKKSKLSRKSHARSKRHCLYLVCSRIYAILPTPG